MGAPHVLPKPTPSGALPPHVSELRCLCTWGTWGLFPQPAQAHGTSREPLGWQCRVPAHTHVTSCNRECQEHQECRWHRVPWC